MVLCRRNRDVRQLEVLSEMKLGSASQPLLLIWASAPSLEPSSAEPSQVSSMPGKLVIGVSLCRWTPVSPLTSFGLLVFRRTSMLERYMRSAVSLVVIGKSPSHTFIVKGIMLPTFWLTLVIHFLLDSTFFLPQIVISATFCAETVWVSLNPVLLLMSKVP
ncbi:hypothetical protein LINPERHAP1_LOCUS17625 [Linum perenne]